jgi:cytidine deaminase
MRAPNDDEFELHQRAREACERAYAPYSRFRVGAALRLGDGSVRCAANVENASYGLSSCAERNAVFAAVADGARAFDAIAVHADARSAPPCGACRQVLSEFAPGLTVVFWYEGQLVSAPLDELLPLAFEL